MGDVYKSQSGELFFGDGNGFYSFFPNGTIQEYKTTADSNSSISDLEAKSLDPSSMDR
jgi:hypothetical protein